MSSTPTHHAVIDTNAVLGWLVFGDADATALANSIAAGQLRWLATPPMREELRSVLARPLPERWEPARKQALTFDAMATAVHCDVPGGSSSMLICRDNTDQMFIDLALARAPSWLITSDRALLALRRRAAARGVVVCTPSQWRASRDAAVCGP